MQLNEPWGQLQGIILSIKNNTYSSTVTCVIHGISSNKRGLFKLIVRLWQVRVCPLLGCTDSGKPLFRFFAKVNFSVPFQFMAYRTKGCNKRNKCFTLQLNSWPQGVGISTWNSQIIPRCLACVSAARNCGFSINCCTHGFNCSMNTGCQTVFMLMLHSFFNCDFLTKRN